MKNDGESTNEEFLTPFPKRRVSEEIKSDLKSPDIEEKLENFNEERFGVFNGDSDKKSMLEETGVRKKRKQVDEGREIYVANRPNDYEQIVGDRKKKQIQLQIKRNKIKELKQLEKQRERQAASLDLEMSGEDVYLMRARRSGLLMEEETEKKSGRREDKARKMMQNMGWKGHGLGKEEQGITVPLIAKKTDNSTGVIVKSKLHLQQPSSPIPPTPPPAPAASSSASSKQKGTQITSSGTKVILLLNMVDEKEIDEDLGDEIVEECMKYGTVSGIHIHVMKDEELPPEEKVRIFVAFEGKESAMKAVVDLNNRYFAGRTVSASFYSELFFSQQIYTN